MLLYIFHLGGQSLMKNNLFSNLSKYAASNTTSPLENFITEAFAWMLQNDSEALETLIN